MRLLFYFVLSPLYLCEYKDQENGFSLETQEERCYEWAKREQFMVVKCFGGAHESAKSDIKRKRFNKMLEFVKNKKNQIDAIIVYGNSSLNNTNTVVPSTSYHIQHIFQIHRVLSFVRKVMFLVR